MLARRLVCRCAAALLVAVPASRDRVSATAPQAALPAAQQPLATVSTDLGEMTFRLSGDAPKAAGQFAKLANEGFYDGTAFHAIHPECIVGGDPRSRLGYGPAGSLIKGDFFFGKVREWGSDESRLYGDAQFLCPAYVRGTETFSPTSGRWEESPCALATRVLAEEGTTTEPTFGAIALALGGKPGMTWPAKAGTVGSQFEIYLGGRRTFYGDAPPIIGELVEGDGVLRAIADVPVTNAYLRERRGRSMPASPSFARPRDVPVRRVGVSRVRVAASARMAVQDDEDERVGKVNVASLVGYALYLVYLSPIFGAAAAKFGLWNPPPINLFTDIANNAADEAMAAGTLELANFFGYKIQAGTFYAQGVWKDLLAEYYASGETTEFLTKANGVCAQHVAWCDGVVIPRP